jgi:hypothetical protein
MSIIVNNRVCDLDTEVIEVIRAMVHSMLPNWQDPQRFFEARSEVSGALTKLLRHASHDPRPLGRATPVLRVVGETASVAAVGRRYTAPRAQALHLAARTFRAAPAPPEPPVDRGLSSRRPAARRSRRHRYPLPPAIAGQGKLAI